MTGKQQSKNAFEPGTFLNSVAKRLRKNRERFEQPEVSYVRRGPSLAEIWFPSGGCIWDFRGYCTTCNFGHPYRVDPEKMVDAVRKAVDDLRFDMPSTLWVSSFNMFDELEVPPDTRREIFDVLANTDATRILTETHPRTITSEIVSECVERLKDKTFGVEIGVESMDDFVRTCCFNKGLPTQCIHEAVDICHNGGAKVIGNLLVGAPFLRHDECISDVCSSIEDALAAGIDEVVLFPVHVKPHTIVEWLFANGLYQPPSLWDLVEILSRFDADTRCHTDLAWVVPKEHPGAEEGVAPSADTDEHQSVVKKLLAYNELGDTAALESLFECARSREKMDDARWAGAGSLRERVVRGYEALGRAILGADWWGIHGVAVEEWVWSEWRENGHRET